MVKTGGTPKVPDCFQRTPKKLCIPEKAEILAVNVDSKGGSLLIKGVYIYFCNILFGVKIKMDLLLSLFQESMQF